MRSEFQEIRVFETADHGRIMMIDGLTMLTENTHHVYHELMVHGPMACTPAAKSALVIGGGDGGAVTELVKYPGLERIVLAELDGAVIEVSRRWFPAIAAGLDDPRVDIRVGDGAAFLAEQANAFDVIIIDSTDICETVQGTEVASPLATDAFYADVKRALRPQGVASQVLGSPIFYRAALAELLHRLDGLWGEDGFRVMRMPTPFYITGEWAAGLYTVNGRLSPDHFSAPLSSLVHANPEVVRGALAETNDIKRMRKGES